jgi:hypothetical protein
LPDNYTGVLAAEEDFQLRSRQEAKSHDDIPTVETLFTTLNGGRIERRTWATRQPVQMAIFEKTNIRQAAVPSQDAQFLSYAFETASKTGASALP